MYFTVEPHFNEDIGTILPCYQVSHYYKGKKTKKYEELGPAKLSCYQRVSFISHLFIMRFHCIVLYHVAKDVYVYVVLFCFVFSCILLDCITLCCIVLKHIALFSAVPQNITVC